MRSHYLSILGLSANATEQEIKKAYRSLSKRFHPDINPDPYAKEQFILIAEAYNYLNENPYGTEFIETPYTQTYKYQPPKETEYQKWKREVKEEKRKQEKANKRALFEFQVKLAGWSKYFVLIVFVFNLLITLDFFLPHRKYNVESIFFKNYKYIFIADDSSKFEIKIKGNEKQIKLAEKTEILASRIFKTIIIINIESRFFGLLKIRKYGSIYFSPFKFIIPLTLLAVFFFFFIVKDSNSKITISLFLFVTFLIQLYLI